MDFLTIPISAFLEVVLMLLSAYQMAIFIYIIMGWLERFNVINTYNQFVYNLNLFLFKIIEPALMPLRRLLPNIAGFDLSPMALLLIVVFFMRVIARFIH